MTAPKIILGEDDKPFKRPLPLAPDLGWFLLGVVGAGFAVIGVVDLFLVWYPPDFGNAEFEFGSVTACLNNMPIVALGLTMWLGSGAARGKKWVVRLGATAIFLLATLIVVGAVLFLTDIPLALQSKVEPLVMTGIKKSILKTLVQAAIYPVVLMYVAVRAWRHTLAPQSETT